MVSAPASQAGHTGSIPAIRFFSCPKPLRIGIGSSVLASLAGTTAFSKLSLHFVCLR